MTDTTMGGMPSWGREASQVQSDQHTMPQLEGGMVMPMAGSVATMVWFC